MDWITGIQKAIDYMEDNLLLDLNINEIAKKACASGFYFQRILMSYAVILSQNTSGTGV